MKKKLLIILSSFLLYGCSTNTNSSNTNHNIVLDDSIDISSVNYYLAFVDNTNFGSVIRETLHIVVSGDFTEEQLFEIAKKETLEYVSKNKVNALVIGFYNNEEEIGHGFAHGRVEYTPNGNFGDAQNVKAGDYSTFQFVNYLTPYLLHSY